MANPIRKPCTRVHFASQIAAEWRKSLQAIFECGHLLVAAKEQLAHGEFTKMIEHDLPFGDRTAERLMAIACDERLTNPTHASLLPQSWMTLYALSRLSDEQFSNATSDGRIRPDMRRADVHDFLDQWELAERVAHVSSVSQNEVSAPAMLPAPAALSLMRSRSAADRVETIASTHLDEAMQRNGAARILESLLALDRESRHGVEAIVGLLLDPANQEKLNRVQRGLGFAIRIKGVLDQAGLRGNPILRVIHETDGA